LRCPNCDVPNPFTEENCQSCGISLAAMRLRVVVLVVVIGIVLLAVGVFLS